uniref:Uncharacterized protein n=1 Tax=Anguilla anguilla TaxID=7936 RepID=A0A0E9WEZ9_ANGAN
MEFVFFKACIGISDIIQIKRVNLMHEYLFDEKLKNDKTYLADSSVADNSPSTHHPVCDWSFP